MDHVGITRVPDEFPGGAEHGGTAMDGHTLVAHCFSHGADITTDDGYLVATRS
jgi:hypothetical protein